MNTNRTIGANPDATRRDDYATPREIYDPIDMIFNFSLDAAASASNHKAFSYITEKQDALNMNWCAYLIADFEKRLCERPTNFNVWLNPPYKGVKAWVEKAWQETRDNNMTVVCLLPPAVDSPWFRDLVIPHAEYFWYAGRIKFVHPTEEKKGPPKGNLLAIFRPPLPNYWHRGG